MKRTVLALLLLLITSNAYAATASLADILGNLRSVITPLTNLVLMISFLGGMLLVFRAVGMLKQFGQPLTQMRQPGEMAGPMVYLFVGAILIYVPSASDTISQTLFGEGAGSMFSNGDVNFDAVGSASAELLSYSQTTISDQWADIANTIVQYIQFIGFVAFIRGWFIISKAGARGEQPGVITKGIVFIISGMLAINFVPMISILKNTIFGM